MMSLTSLLARDGVVSLDTIEQALQRQVLEGGEIDTALLEVGTVPENVLGAYRAASFELPAASRAQLEQLHAGLLARVPFELARQHRVVPIALDGGVLVLATDAPKPLLDVQGMSRALDAKLSFRIATELRVQLALAAGYGIDVPSRMRLLEETLRGRDPGELREVQPWQASRTAPPTRTAREMRAAHAPSSDASLQPVRVVPMVALGAEHRRRASDREDPRATVPERPSSRPPIRPPSPAPLRKSLRRGPLTSLSAIELLATALDRDQVLQVFFSFARQYFECAVLFALRDERLLGLDGSGLSPSVDLQAVEAGLSRGGGLHAATLSREPKVLDLRADAPGRALAEAIGRTDAQPCVVMPIMLRERIVSLLYGDRGGEPLALSDLSELLMTLPAVSAAFQRIIHERRLAASEARGKHRVPPRGVKDTPPEGAFRRSSRPARALRQELERRPAPFSVLGVRGDVPPPPRLPAEARSGLPGLDRDFAERPTMQLSSDGIASKLGAAAEPKTKSASYSQRDAPTDQVRARRQEKDTTRPERPSKLPISRAPAKPQSRPPTDPPPPRTLSQAPPGAGSYAVRKGETETLHRKPEAPHRKPEAPPAARPPASSEAARKPRTDRADPRREEGADAVQQESVTIPPSARDSIRPPRGEEREDGPEALVVDLGGEAERLVEELCASGPDEERPVVSALLRLGDAALPALKRRFPGPLWFDRQKLRQRMPPGRDISAIARALFAFEERAVPHIAELLAAPAAEVRLCATLMAADRVEAELLWPLYQRLFDADGSLRLLAFETLPLYRNAPGFEEVLKSLRGKASDQHETLPTRLAALEAISVVRDPGSVELLISLCGHDNRQLSVAAHRTLLAITAQDFGDSERKWKSWLDKNKNRHRAEWLIDGLMHAEERVRGAAAVELQKLSQVYYGYVASAPKRERERAQERYREWWQNEGRSQFE